MTNEKYHPDFSSIKRRANGMLSPEVYRKIHECATKVRAGLILEIGTAHGAGTIAMALAAKDVGSRVATVEKIMGGSRERFGGMDENLTIIRRNFEEFGVTDVIDLHIGDVEEIHDQIDTSGGIGLLMLDADGAIDRDLGIFYEHLNPGAIIIIDDYADMGRVFKKANGRCRIDLKHRLTYRLVNHFESIGALSPDELINNTYFGIVPSGSADRSVFSDNAVTKVYRSLVHTDGRLENSIVVRSGKVYTRLKRVVGRLLGR